MYNIFIKAEANELVGNGHLHRSIALANQLIKLGAKVEFIFAESPITSINKVKKGFNVNLIDKSKQLDTNTYTNFIPQNSLVLFDTDNYNFYSGKLISGLQKNKIKTACFTITDKYPIMSDIIINTNIISTTHTYKAPKNTIKLLGPQYLIFNREFSKIPSSSPQNNSKLNLILFMGNADSNNLTEQLISTIDLINNQFNKINIIVGSLNTNKDKIKKKVLSLNNKKIKLFININTKQIIDIYKKSNIAITSAGMTMWEMALFKIPQIVIASSNREIQYTDYLKGLNLIRKLCNYNNIPSKKKLASEILSILSNKKLDKINTEEFYRIINPNGIKEIAKAFIKVLS